MKSMLCIAKLGVNSSTEEGMMHGGNSGTGNNCGVVLLQLFEAFELGLFRLPNSYAFSIILLSFMQKTKHG